MQQRKERTHERARVRWKRWRRPRNMMKDRGGKERVDTSQKGISKPPAGHWQRKPPSAPLVQVPPLRHTPGTHRPARLSTSQFSPAGARPQAWDAYTAATHVLLVLGMQTSAWIQDKAAEGKASVEQLGASKGYDNPSVTQVLPTVASELATTASPAQATGLDVMPALAEGATLDPVRHGNGTGGHRPQLGCTVLRMEKHAREVLVMLRVPPCALPPHRPGTGISVLSPGCGDSPVLLSSHQQP